MYTVKEVAKRLDLTEHTVRYYTDKGLVPNLMRDENNNRLFDEESIHWLSAVKNLKRCDMPLNDIKKYVDLCIEGESTMEERYNMVKKQKEIVLKQLKEYQEMSAYIINKEQHYKDIVNNVVSDDTNPVHW